MDLPNKPMISVITAVYNGESFLQETIKSVLSQTYTNFEYVIIDDGSNDSTPSILKKFSELDSRVITYRIKNSGPAIARNTALKMTKGEWIANLDSDDICLPNRLKEQERFIRKNPECVLLGSGCDEIDADGRTIKTHSYPSDHQSLVRNLERMRGSFPHSSMVFKKIVGSKPIRYNPRFVRCHDLDMCLSLTRVGKVCCIDDMLVKIRKHDESISNTDFGELSTLMSYLVLICHFRWKTGFSDPSIMRHDEYEEFVSWLRNRMEELGIFRDNRAWQTFRKTFYTSKGNIIIRLVKISEFLYDNLEAFMGFRWRLSSSRLMSKLFKESRVKFK